MKKYGIIIIIAMLLSIQTAFAATNIITEWPSDEIMENIPPEHRNAATISFLQAGEEIHVVFQWQYYVIDPEPKKEVNPITGEEVSVITSSYKNVYRCYKLTEDDALLPCKKNCADLFQKGHENFENGNELPYSLCFKAYAGTTYALLYDGTLCQWNPKAEDTWQPVMQLDVQAHGCDFHARENFTYDWTEDTIYFYIANEKRLYAISIPDGVWTPIAEGIDTEGLYAGDTNQLLLEKRSFSCLNTETGEKKNFMSGYVELPRMFSPDAHGEWLLVGLESVYKTNRKGESERVYTFPVGIDIYMLTIASNGDLLYVTENDNRLYLNRLKLNEEDAEVTKLTIVGSQSEFDTIIGYLPITTSFFADKPNVQLDMASDGNDFDTIAKQLVVQNGNFDIMSLRTSEAPLTNLYVKGYFRDLSDRAGIVDYVSHLHPVWRDACMAGDRVAALPLSVESSVMFYDVGWNELELGDVPTTWSELLDVMEQCSQMGIWGDYRLFGVTGSRYGVYERLVYQVLRQWIASISRTGGVLTFQQPELMEVLTRLQALKPMLDAQDNMVGGTPILWDGRSVTWVTTLGGVEGEASRPLPLGFRGEEDKAIVAYMTLLVVNPYSPDGDLAADYLDYIAQHPTAYAQCVLQDGQPAYLINEKKAEDAKQHEAFIAQTREAMEAARKEGDMELALQLEDTLDTMETQRAIAYDVTPEKAAMYYAALPYLTLVSAEDSALISGDGEKYIESFIAGGMDATTLLRQLDRVAQMQRMENQ